MMGMRSRWLAWPARSLWVWVVVGAATTVLGTTASADVLCKRRSGEVVVRSPECKKKEVPLDPAALGLQGPEGPPGQPGAAGSGGYAVVDSVGVVVGRPMLNVDGPSIYAVRVLDDGAPVYFQVGPSYLRGAPGALLYESTDCTGSPYMWFYTDSPVLHAAFLPADAITGHPTQTLYYGKGASETRTIRSQRNEGDGSCDALGTAEISTVQPAVSATVPAFTPPFTIR